MRHLTSKTAADQVIAHMEDWLRLSPRTYTATVRLFALRLPPEKLVEALGDDEGVDVWTLEPGKTVQW